MDQQMTVVIGLPFEQRKMIAFASSLILDAGWLKLSTTE